MIDLENDGKEIVKKCPFMGAPVLMPVQKEGGVVQRTDAVALQVRPVSVACMKEECMFSVCDAKNNFIRCGEMRQIKYR